MGHRVGSLGSFRDADESPPFARPDVSLGHTAYQVDNASEAVSVITARRRQTAPVPTTRVGRSTFEHHPNW